MSWGWLSRVLKECRKLNEISASNLKAKAGEIMVLQALNDTYVDGNRVKKFFLKRGVNVIEEEGYHDLLEEGKGEVSDRVIEFVSQPCNLT